MTLPPPRPSSFAAVLSSPRSPSPLVVLALVLVAAGCLAPAPDGAGSTASTATATTPTATTPPGATVVEVIVVDVVDGDTLRVRYENGVPDTVRLLGVDAPELGGSADPNEYEGVPDTAAGAACLRAAGATADGYLERRLADEEIRVVLDPRADDRDRYGRLLGYVSHRGRNVNYLLVAAGHARVFDAAFSKAERFHAAETRARAAGRGLWACRTPGRAATSDHPLAVVEVHADAAGRDGENLNDEYVAFHNAGDAPLDLSGWTVADAAGHVYSVPQGVTLAPGATLTLRTGSGPDTGTELHWGSTTPVWNNDGDVIVVANASGSVVLRESYDRGG